MQHQAKDYCKENGANLASVTNIAINDLLVNISSGYMVHIGAERVGGDWIWPDGSIWSYTNWKDGQGHGTNESCAVMDRSNGKWEDWPCDATLWFICSQNSHKRKGKYKTKTSHQLEVV